MGKKAPKDNSVQAAGAQGKANLDVAKYEASANRPDQYNPFGSIEWTAPHQVRGEDGKRMWKTDRKGNVKKDHRGKPIPILDKSWTQEMKLNEPYQNILDKQTETIQQQQDVQQGMLGNMANNPIDTSGMGASDMSKYGMLNMDQFGGPQSLEYDPTGIRNQAQDAAYNYATNRLDPQFQKAAQAKEIDLRQRGLRPGDQAYDAAMSSFNNSKNDAYGQAMWSSFGEGRQEAGQLYDQQLGSAQFANQTRQGEIDNAMQNLEQGFGRDQASKQQALAALLGGRQQQLSEYQAVNPGEDIAGAMDTFGA